MGRNPARIIPVWRAFADKHADVARGIRGIGEPVWAGRSPDELVECGRHEALLNIALAAPPTALDLVCCQVIAAQDRLAVGGLIALSAAVCASMFLVFDVLFDEGTAGALVVLVGLAYAWFWYGLPIVRRF